MAQHAAEAGAEEDEQSRSRQPWRGHRPRATRPAVDPLTRLPAPLLPELRPVLEPLPDLALEAALRRVVEALPAERLGEVVLAGEGVGLVVVVAVARAVAFSSSARSAR